MQICVIGTGYVGLVAGTCLADMGHSVTCVDKDEDKIEGLKEGVVPIYEPGLDHLIHRNVREGRLAFTTDGASAIGASEVVYIAVGTPGAEDGSADLRGVMAVSRLIGASMRAPVTVIIKSTVPVGTADQVRAAVGEQAAYPYDVVSNPEFLKEGAAIDDFLKPDRIVVGCKEDATRDVMRRLYAPLLRTGKPILFMDNRSAELTKYASNAFLATKISFINELSLLCERVGADVDAVRRGAGSDSRIGPRFLFPGVGYGGSCFPKDVQALMVTARQAGFPLRILDAVHDVNEQQKHVLGIKIIERFGPDMKGLRVAVWGLSFKPQTDDMREAPSVIVIRALLDAGAEVVAYDPEAMEEARHHLGDRVRYAKSHLEAVEGADALALITEWNEFRMPPWDEMTQRMRQKVVFDGRNIYDPEAVVAAGFEYHGIGRPGDWRPPST
ncbi:MAG: UDP-glucose/GDP-mannose dehydrogenase family protein [Alphaproteobacteria bacterium]|nr:UDP-glucose/GDP-mannose dehydrogenase family protein [Alphaproteobacteria bacterium]MCB9791631.1 UDP-glucose/GDP-mannose dehydrogenase family protein [Alphaproteobacteria bacterium]